MLKRLIKYGALVVACLALLGGCRACGCAPQEGPKLAAKRTKKPKNKKPTKVAKHRPDRTRKKKPDSTKKPTPRGEIPVFKKPRMIIKPGTTIGLSRLPVVSKEEMNDPRLVGMHPAAKKAIKILEYEQKNNPRYKAAREKAMKTPHPTIDKKEVGVH
ncbi:MAG: hypothetical protein JRJ19_12050 [Deltaproteobacteria bacterium]|nr:hypothetical protein [Deltaproteobacteria bacterium]MBW1872792.1 hypothetical protein [Deltaproteobacteria bacterium]